MKKVGLIIIAFMFCIFWTNTYAKEKVTVYVFIKDKEEICENTITFLNEFKESSEIDFKVEKRVVWDENWKEDSVSRNLVDIIAAHFNKEVLGAPIIVVGDHYFDEYSDKVAEEIKAAIIKENDNDNYKDVVKQLSVSAQEEKENNNLWSYIILGFSMIGIIVFIIISRQSIKKDSV